MKQETPIPYQLLAELLKLRGESQQADWSKALELLHMLEDPIESSKSQIKAPKLKEQKGDEVDQSNYTSLAISDSSTNLERLLMKSKLLQTNADLIAFGRAALNIDLTKAKHSRAKMISRFAQEISKLSDEKKIEILKPLDLIGNASSDLLEPSFFNEWSEVIKRSPQK
jgi:hypothetical protein